MPELPQDMVDMRVVYFWHNGCYLNTLYDEFDSAYAEMCGQFGFPEFATVRGEEDWDHGPRSPEQIVCDTVGPDRAVGTPASVG